MKKETHCRHFMDYFFLWGWGVVMGQLFLCPYPLKVRARPLQDQKLALQFRVLGQEGFSD